MTTRPYTALAPFYSGLMQHVHYPMWGDYLWDLILQFEGKGEKILEVSAGTCPLADIPQFKGKTVFTDISLSMLKAAEGVLTDDGLKREMSTVQNRVVCDALKLPFHQHFDTCIMIYDSINYLLTTDEVLQCFREVRQALLPGGLFLFDITTERNSLNYFSDTLDVEEQEAGTLIRESFYDRKKKHQINKFTLFTPRATESESLFQKTVEEHTQRIYSVQEIIAVAKESGFKVLAHFEDYSSKTSTRQADRVHFALRVI